ncbi:MAG: TlpA family protein disulfide reductase [Myxococcales bacterium]|nr:TlpA family protein disulfide reductase [Myxococcales bacterium]
MAQASMSWSERLLSEKVLYPLLAVVALVVVGVVAFRPRSYGSAADFSLPVVDAAGNVGAERVSLGGLRGRVVVLDFWATWCAPCRAEIPILQRLHTQYAARGVTVLGVNVDEGGPGLVPRFRERFGMQYPIAYDVGAQLSGAYQVEGLPTLMVIDRQGVIRLRHAGMAPESMLSRAIERAL